MGLFWGVLRDRLGRSSCLCFVLSFGSRCERLSVEQAEEGVGCGLQMLSRTRWTLAGSLFSGQWGTAARATKGHLTSPVGVCVCGYVCMGEGGGFFIQGKHSFPPKWSEKHFFVDVQRPVRVCGGHYRQSPWLSTHVPRLTSRRTTARVNE